MNTYRLTTLADGIFSIVMTLMVIYITVPEVSGHISNADVARILWGLVPIFGSFVLSFAVLATYWIAHHYIMSVYALNMDRRLMFWNMPFFMVISLVPFSSHLLGSYPTTPLSIWVYSIHVIIIAILLWYLFWYILHSPKIKNPPIDSKDIKLTYIRILLPAFCAVLAIILSVINSAASIGFLIFAVVVNLIPGMLHGLDRKIARSFNVAALRKKKIHAQVQPSRTRRRVVRDVWVAR